jgi:hypothetical protein
MDATYYIYIYIYIYIYVCVCVSVSSSLCMWQWWDGELERRALLYRARALHDTYTTHQEAPTRPVPGYVEARVEAGLALPKVEVVAGPREVAGGERPPKRTSAALRAQAAAEKRQRKHAMLEWVMRELSAEVFTELMQGFHAPHN